MPETNPQNGAGRPLPKKEADLFKNVIKHYETKQYKKAIKQADTILKKFPNHGETLAMKGLVLNNMAKRDEAHALVKQGLMNDMRSHVCWHVYGLLHRSDRNYNEAIKAYKQALRIEADSLQILRDLSMLQIQMRDLDGFAVTRHNILTMKPNGKINWLAFALAKHLNGDLRGAISVIDIYLGTLTEGAPELSRGFEASELAMYRNQILSEIPDNTKEALEHLETCKPIVVDETSWLISKTRFQLTLGQHAEAKETALRMFKRGMTENSRIHSLYMCAVLGLDKETCDKAYDLPGTRSIASFIPLTSEQKQQLLDAYQNEIFPEYERSAAVKRIPLNLVEGDRFRNSLDVYMRKSLVKGVPSLCLELSSFVLVEKDGKYEIASDPLDIKEHSAFKLIVELADGYISCLEANSKLLADDEFEEPPSTELWAWYLRAGLHELAGEYESGIALLDKCIEHTPTLVDLYELKGRLIRSSGDMKSAVDILDKGRDLDRQDRYINNQTTKYMLEAGMDADALDRISMFTKHEGNPEANLYDMQCSWYELGLAACYARQEKWGKALRKYACVVKHFDDFHEDQFDFHSYCIRKVTLRAYTQVLKFEDNLWSEDYYFSAASGIIKIYLYLYDNPATTQQDAEPDYSKMTAAERKKAKAIARKKKKQAEKKKAEREKKEGANGDKGDQANGGKKTDLDEDPNGEEMMKRDPLEEGKKYSAILSKHCQNKLETWALQYDVSIRRKKWLLALQALFKLQKMDSGSSEFFQRVVDFGLKASDFGEQAPAVKAVLTDGCAELLQKLSVPDFVNQAVEKVQANKIASLPLRVAVAEALMLTNTSAVDAATALIIKGGLDGRDTSVESCRKALAALKGFKSKSVPEWVSAVKQRYPRITDFS
eukprot:CAMPEP_0113648350 /NCGR_PEP_ID=MMETSP0017_2-20120614/25641_1 /TAXON_ID=2856 /ORGANISM="Cylindrotheca closterium" /LENGTH=886 /DNA_ID=CAMNT_0000560555 /DNA_START=100 /DNA_END=2760 /DNA_ORIENTATION=+ /assembly_acc=CAM_ASM_000147